MKESNRIHAVRPHMAVGDEPLCLGHLERKPVSPELLRALISDSCEHLEQYPALYVDKDLGPIAGVIWVDKLARTKDQPMNALASDLRSRAVRAANPEGFDGYLVCGNAVLVLPIVIDEGGA